MEIKALVISGVEPFDLGNVLSRERVRPAPPLGIDPTDSSHGTDQNDRDQQTPIHIGSFGRG